MKASDMVHKLRELQSKHGDLEVVNDRDEPVQIEFSEGSDVGSEDAAFVIG